MTAPGSTTTSPSSNSSVFILNKFKLHVWQS
jgi:hypothetical protein